MEKIMSKGVNKILILIIVLSLCANTFAAVVSDNDGSAFITKSEFDSLKNDFQAQINQYNTSIDNKIDEAIAGYLSGIKVSTKTNLMSILNNINAYGYNYSNMGGYPFTNYSPDLSCTTQTPEVNVNGMFSFQNLCCSGTMWVGRHHCGAKRENVKARNGAGTCFEFITINGYKCLSKKVNIFEILSFAIADAPAAHQTNNYGLRHSYESSIRNTSTNLNTETVPRQTSGWYRKTSSTGTGWATTTLSSGGAYLTLTKSIKTSDSDISSMYCAPINTISSTTYGYGYESGTDLGTILTNTDPIGGETATDNYTTTFNQAMYYSCDQGSSCIYGENSRYPAMNTCQEILYWNKHYVNTSRFDLTQLYVYPATVVYGSGVKYYNGLPICRNSSSDGILTFSLKPTTTTSGTLANRVQLCFRTKPFPNLNPSEDTVNNMKNIYYKQQGTSTWTKCNGAGGVERLVPGTTYDFMIEDFPAGETLWVKPYDVRNTSSTSTWVYAFLSTVGDIVIEKN